MHLQGNLEVRRVYLHTHPWAFSALCSLASSLPTTARSLAKAKLLQGWSGSRSWGFKGITAHEWAPLGMWDTPSLTQGPQSCHSTQVLLQKTKSTREVFTPRDQNRASPELCGASCCVGGPILSLEPAADVAADHCPAGVILGEGMQESQLFCLGNVWQAGGVCAWHAQPGKPAGEKDP